ncbi:Ornithine decarboxylase [Vitis vinifera]|uniref:ornithine decarboxylase n=1 Tax=Vitis vinifera TaxID=29760 RepID=A0A438K432_VITVI|nr:Ornithine decarboxylase [Vitis vinifera]
MGSNHKSLQAILGAPGVRGKRVTALSKDGLTDFVLSMISKKQELKEPFYVLDLGVVVSLMEKWSRALPLVQPFYAVKCNPDPTFLAALAALGSRFDCASRTEVETVLGLGVSSDQIIFANPCKAESHINGARCPLESKYGALPEEVTPLLQAAQDARLTVSGVSFHIGSGATLAQAYRGAIAEARAVFDTASRLGLPRMHVLNIGGGFTSGPHFDDATSAIKSSLQAYFPNEHGLTIIAEPGRYFAESAFTLVTNIIGKRVRSELREYWINDGIYGSLNCILNDHATVTAKPLACTSNSVNPTCRRVRTYSSTVFGPTCDALDTVLTGHQLPELQVNDWLMFPRMGAYTAAAGSNFNGFNMSAVTTHLVYSNPT